MCFDFFLQILSETFLFLRRPERDKFINVAADIVGLHVK